MSVVGVNPVLCSFRGKIAPNPVRLPRTAAGAEEPDPECPGPGCLCRELVLLYWSIGHDILARQGIAFVGSQVPLSVGDQDFYLDLLFYHVRLHRYFIVELKTGPFKPEYAGKLNFYLSAVDGILRTERDDPSIGLLLCESHSGPVVEYAFKDIQKPIGVSTYRVTLELPTAIREELPTVEDLQEVVSKLRHEIEALKQENR
jgi:hypothetical protein